MSRTISLVAYRPITRQRAHFGIYVPRADDSNSGTQIHVVGAPMIGYTLEFKRNYNIPDSPDPFQIWQIGQVDCAHVIDSADNKTGIDVIPGGDLEVIASQVKPPPAGQNPLMPIDGVNYKRCQEWTMEYIERLVKKNILDQDAIAIVQSHRDSSTHGIGLKLVNQTAQQELTIAKEEEALQIHPFQRTQLRSSRHERQKSQALQELPFQQVRLRSVQQTQEH